MSTTPLRAPAPDSQAGRTPSGSSARPRWIGRVALGYFALSAIALVAPVYTAVGNHIEPRVLGLPWSLVYVLVVVLANAAVLAVLYAGRWVDADDGIATTPEAAQTPEHRGP